MRGLQFRDSVAQLPLGGVGVAVNAHQAILRISQS